ncbi:VOC family protein [Catellatospora tritici]|uniref:VOC family protein n=1 Tax=Catellatospora tritici TaxID=2851566 RepID=UPI001C2DF110|nr:VOC family protein [Catellatospora tritici]MBV1850351.1 VOC family protein [Catellatospora tritici]
MANAFGVPTWVDLSTTDLKAATEFYTDLFGWEAEVSPEPEAGGYTTFRLDGSAVAGAGPIEGGEGQPSLWTTYVEVHDAEQTAQQVAEAGGNVLLEPFDVHGHGKMAVFLDQAGAMFAVWQPGTSGGGQVFRVPGTLAWNELTTRDVDGSKEFYGGVFGWDAHDLPFGSVTYTEWQVAGRSIAGMMPMEGDEWPADLPPHWMVYFHVADTDAAAQRVRELGGTVCVPPTDIPPGRFAVCEDPQGGVFAVIRVVAERLAG